ncbi:hypothetical protein ACFVMC_19305 [Nocardia sp. NPDC127579]|uniref:hypothetical protein n=1 Tax=Nocardia sp. NPDC127579 TaxID=3345402 RepID=UPI0036354B6E
MSGNDFPRYRTYYSRLPPPGWRPPGKTATSPVPGTPPGDVPTPAVTSRVPGTPPGDVPNPAVTSHDPCTSPGDVSRRAVASRLPGTVRAARVISFGMAGLGVVVTVVLGALFGAGRAGAAGAGFLCSWLAAGLACRFGDGGRRVRAGAVAVSLAEGVLGLGTAAAQRPPGLPSPPGS